MSRQDLVAFEELESPLGELVDLVGRAFPSRDEPLFEAPHRVAFRLEDVRGRPVDIRVVRVEAGLHVSVSDCDRSRTFETGASVPEQLREVCRWLRRGRGLRLLAPIS